MPWVANGMCRSLPENMVCAGTEAALHEFAAWCVYAAIFFSFILSITCAASSYGCRLQSMTHACTASLCAAVQQCCSTWRAQEFGRKHLAGRPDCLRQVRVQAGAHINAQALQRQVDLPVPAHAAGHARRASRRNGGQDRTRVLFQGQGSPQRQQAPRRAAQRAQLDRGTHEPAVEPDG